MIKNEKKNPLFVLLKNIMRRIKKKPEIINLNDEPIPDSSILISNHSSASGPFTLALFFPVSFVPWGTHEMTENYKERFKYLYYIFYQKKLGYGKFKSFMLAWSFAIISKLVYNGMRLIPTYRDTRLLKTIKKSLIELNSGNSVLVFPEDSNKGYKDVLTYYNGGFILLSKERFKKTKIDTPIYTIYYSKKCNKIVIDKPSFLQQLLAQGYNEVTAAKFFLERTNTLYKKYILNQE